MSRDPRENWDDLRFVLAVAEAGSVAAAARRLGVNHATVLRRVAGFEARLGGPVFERDAAGYRVLPERRRMIEALREVAAAIGAVGRIGEAARPAAPVRVTSTDTFCQAVLPGILAELAGDPAMPRIELNSSIHHVDLSRPGAEITIRPAARLADELRGLPAGVLGFAAYAAKGAGALPWLRLTGGLVGSVPGQVMAEHVAPDQLGNGADSFQALTAMARAGLGRAYLPCLLGDAAPELARLPGALPRSEVPIWVASHADLAGIGRLDRLRRRLAEALQARADRLSGAAGQGG